MTARNRHKIAAAKFLALAAIIAVAAHGGAAHAQASLFGAPRQPEVTGIARWIFQQQAAFYRALSSAIREAKTDGTATWTLIGISFIYGVFHAAGPGHGKAVIASYVVANRETWRRGVILSFASALLQAITAVIVVIIGAVLLGATAKTINNSVRIIEIASYSLIVVLGLRLIWVKGVGFARALQCFAQERSSKIAPGTALSLAGHPHGHALNATACGCGHDHGAQFSCQSHAHDGGHHHHDLDVLPWGHAHGPEPRELAGPGGWRRGLSAIVGVGLRPCSGAILVLVFALAQDLFWTGVASTLTMGLGTAMTVAASATLAVGATSVMEKVAKESDGYGTLAMRALEVAAAIIICLFGVLLLAGYIASERLAGF